MSPEPPAGLGPHREPPPESYPFWGYLDLWAFALIAALGWWWSRCWGRDSASPSRQADLRAVTRAVPAVRISAGYPGRDFSALLWPAILALAALDARE